MTTIKSFIPLKGISDRKLWLVAFIVLAGGSGYSLQTATESRNEIVKAANKAVLVSCFADKENATVQKGIIDLQIKFVKDSREPEPPTSRSRIKAPIEQQKRIVVPNCAERVKDLEELKSNAN